MGFMSEVGGGVMVDVIPGPSFGGALVPVLPKG